jgi:hypothetical protein
VHLPLNHHRRHIEIEGGQDALMGGPLDGRGLGADFTLDVGIVLR